jgi:hypothetical protein
VTSTRSATSVTVPTPSSMGRRQEQRISARLPEPTAGGDTVPAVPPSLRKAEVAPNGRRWARSLELTAAQVRWILC